MSVVDPLDALLSAVRASFPILPVEAYNAPAPSLREATHLRLSETLTLPKTAPTRLRRVAASGARDPDADPDAFFALGAVYLAWALRDSSGAEYMKQARDLPGAFVGVTERRGVADYVAGALPTLDRLVPPPGSAPASTTPPGSPPARAVAATPRGEKRRHVPDAADLEAVRRIRHQQADLRDRASVLRGPKPTPFPALRDAFAAKLRALRDPKRAAAPAAPAPDPHRAPKQRAQHPIILISSAPTALVTMHNVRAFLEDAAFVPPADARAAAQGARPEDVVPIYRQRGDGKVRYMVVDSAGALAKFGPDAWERVVCVLTTGQSWQFKAYKWPEPRALFQRVLGVHVCWANEPPNAKIRDWNVTELKIDPHRRHVDKSLVAHFWKVLDDWTVQHKPGLVH